MESKPTQIETRTNLNGHPLTRGMFIADRYEILELIGQGAAGAVYKVKHLALNKEFALKALNAGVMTDDKSLRRFDAEAKTVGKLSNPYLIQVHDYGVTDSGIPYLVMDYIEGTNLSGEIARARHIEEERAIKLFSRVCVGLECAHANQIVHRDLKPSNIMLQLDERGEEIPRIVDFGIAKRQSSDSGLTQTGEIFGTPLYMSPEQCLGKPIDFRSDIYSLGCVMYEALSGSPPLAGSNPVETILRHVNDAPISLRKACVGWKVSADLEKVVMACLEKDPAHRPSSVEVVRQNLERISRGERTAMKKSFHRRKSPNYWIISLLVLSLAGAGVVCYWLSLPHRSVSEEAKSSFDKEYRRAAELHKAGRNQESIDVLRAALEKSQPNLDAERQINTYLALSSAYLKVGDSADAADNFDKAVTFVSNMNDKVQAFHFYNKIADRTSDARQQLSLHESALALCSTAFPNDSERLVNSLIKVIRDCFVLRIWDKAADRVQYARELIRTSPNVDDSYKLQVEELSGISYEKAGHFDSALDHYRQARALAEHLKSDKHAKYLANRESHVLELIRRQDASSR